MGQGIYGPLPHCYGPVQLCRIHIWAHMGKSTYSGSDSVMGSIVFGEGILFRLGIGLGFGLGVG